MVNGSPTVITTSTTNGMDGEAVSTNRIRSCAPNPKTFFALNQFYVR